jgi:hypothetical protein
MLSFAHELRAALTIPQDIIDQFIPANTVSIVDFIHNTRVPETWDSNFHPAQAIFSEDDPSFAAQNLLLIPLPTEHDVKKLRVEVDGAWHAGARSLQGLDPGSTADLPLWFVSWAEIMHTVIHHHERWTKVCTRVYLLHYEFN